MKKPRHSEFRRSLVPVGRCPVRPHKIAVCFFGATRNFSKYTLNSIERNVFAQVAQLDPKFKKLAHFNILFPASGEPSPATGSAIDPEEYRLLNCDLARHTDLNEADRRIDFEFINRFEGDWNCNFVSLRDLLRNFYSLGAVTELLLGENARFDLVIFLRADLRFNRPLKIPEVQPRTVYTPWFDRYHGLNDRFAMGDFETMVAYGKRQKSVLACSENKHRPLCDKHNLVWFAREHGWQVRHLPSIDFVQIRSNGVVSAVDCFRETKLDYYFQRGLEALKLCRL